MTDSTPLDLSATLRDVVSGKTLSVAEAEAMVSAFVSGDASDVQIGALLAAIQARGPTPSEVAGGVRALRSAMYPVEVSNPDTLVDTAGTGGGTITTFNISTAAALVAAGADVRMAKHGNRSFTSRSGSADVLEALGVRIDLEPARMGEILEEVGIVFMFAPLLHPAMRHVGPVRRTLRIPTLMNLLGPLTNPAGARRQVVGVSDPALVPLIVGALGELGHLRALVVHGEGIDEVSPLGPSRVAELDGDGLEEYRIAPSDLGEEIHPVEGLAGGEPEDNAEIIRGVLSGSRTGAARTAVVMNAAAAILVGGRAASFAEAADVARASLDSGAAAARLDALREASNV
ncbi:MAG TPA: anthranilate phosphoribosyltransferase [Longimicrobiales bacterium]|nr:anthranilate phosphoribosyltransferase [Longimicrobiales bacterium]